MLGFKRSVYYVLMTLPLVAGCGTQIGNPTGAGLVRVSDNSRVLATVVNAAFLQSVDGINAGDYAYAKSESRASTDRICNKQAGSAFSLTNQASGIKHSVTDENQEWFAKSDLSIDRRYEDAWTQNQKLLACEDDRKSIRFESSRIASGAYVLTSKVQEDLSRRLFMTEKKLQQELRHNLILQKSGERQVSFVRAANAPEGLQIDGELLSQLESVIALNPVDDGLSSLAIQQADRIPLRFQVQLNGAGEWERYVIPSGRQEFFIPASGETLRLEFFNVTFERSQGCMPTQGQLTASVLRPGQSSVSYQLRFVANTAPLLKQSGGTDSFVLAPFACVLKER